MAKKAPTEPMECQSTHYGDAVSMCSRADDASGKPPFNGYCDIRRLGRDGTSTIPYQAARSNCDHPQAKERTDCGGVRSCSARLGHQNKIGSCWK